MHCRSSAGGIRSGRISGYSAASRTCQGMSTGGEGSGPAFESRQPCRVLTVTEVGHQCANYTSRTVPGKNWASFDTKTTCPSRYKSPGRGEQLRPTSRLDDEMILSRGEYRRVLAYRATYLRDKLCPHCRPLCERTR